MGLNGNGSGSSGLMVKYVVQMVQSSVQWVIRLQGDKTKLESLLVHGSNFKIVINNLIQAI